MKILTIKDLCVFPKQNGTIIYQRASYIECGWYIVFDGGVYGVYYIPSVDWMGDNDFHGTRETLQEALDFALTLSSMYT